MIRSRSISPGSRSWSSHMDGRIIGTPSLSHPASPGHRENSDHRRFPGNSMGSVTIMEKVCQDKIRNGRLQLFKNRNRSNVKEKRDRDEDKERGGGAPISLSALSQCTHHPLISMPCKKGWKSGQKSHSRVHTQLVRCAGWRAVAFRGKYAPLTLPDTKYTKYSVVRVCVCILVSVKDSVQ